MHISVLDGPMNHSRLGMLCRLLVSRFELLVLNYYKRSPREREGRQILRDLYARQASIWSVVLGRSLPVLYSPHDLFALWVHAKSLQNHGGAFAEVGAFRGDSAEIICEAKGYTAFYVFEAFEGLPAEDSANRQFPEGLFASDEDSLRRRLAAYPSTHVIAGYFPATAASVRHLSFSFVHLDLDLYQGTADALSFFYSRVLPGGRIVSHDYSNSPGVWRAFDDFFSGKPERVEPLGTSLVVVIKE